MATSVGQVFEVYASKTEADAKALASSKPGAMCFTTDTHRIVFNGVVYNLVEIINNLTDGSTNKALSAAQGKALKGLIDALPTVDEMNTAINGKLGSVYRVMGTKANISEVLALTNAVKGDTWNVTAEFTLGGKKYPAGTNVVCVTNTSSSDHNDDNWDALGGTVDLSAFLKAADAASTYLKKKDAESTYVTKVEFDALDEDYNAQLDAMSEALDKKLAKSDVVNVLTDSSTAKALSAAMGKKLQDEKLSKTEASGTYATKADLNNAKPYVCPGDLATPANGCKAADITTAFGTYAQFKAAYDSKRPFWGKIGTTYVSLIVEYYTQASLNYFNVTLYYSSTTSRHKYKTFQLKVDNNWTDVNSITSGTLNTSVVVQETGLSTTAVMSQDAVTKLLTIK